MDLYAGRWRTFRQITLQLSAPGIVTGSLLVFIPMMGEYVVPAMLGRGRVFLIGNVLYLDFLDARNWPQGSAMAVVVHLALVPPQRAPQLLRAEILAEGCGVGEGMGRFGFLARGRTQREVSML